MFRAIHNVTKNTKVSGWPNKAEKCQSWRLQQLEELDSPVWTGQWTKQKVQKIGRNWTAAKVPPVVVLVLLPPKLLSWKEDDKTQQDYQDQKPQFQTLIILPHLKYS
ncbi:hypothetical protein OsI_06181 [Oryza sativa Indica Group]|uniref:Uncharacterized protein n=2 Tax=Oryza sativa TaxID=4530 RepID=B9F3S6_ORYSJ|nr:hypothetical protein OsI_06181 [Oryza sativa Indica Group]EEE56478.1 hypothetical protein OsJ_05698 [Oryza sativa Japonica Group]